MPRAEATQHEEESMGGVVVAALGLYRLDDQRRHVAAARLAVGHQPINLGKTPLLLGRVGEGVRLQRVRQPWEWRHWPVKGGDVELVRGLAVRRGERAEGAPVEGTVEGEDRGGTAAGRLGGREWVSRRGRVSRACVSE